MFYLYLKTHNTTNKKYIGHTTQEPFSYKGSGKHWKLHIKKHGYDVTTIVLYETLYIEELSELGLYYSDLWNIVESEEFANLMVETGQASITSEETKRKISKIHKGKILSEDTKRKMSEAKKGKTRSVETILQLSESQKGKTLSTETKRKISESKMGKTHSEESKRKMSESAKNRSNH